MLLMWDFLDSDFTNSSHIIIIFQSLLSPFLQLLHHFYFVQRDNAGKYRMSSSLCFYFLFLLADSWQLCEDGNGGGRVGSG